VDAQQVNRTSGALLAVAALLCATVPARAQSGTPSGKRIDIAAGKLSERVPELARQAGLSISVTSDKLWRTRARPVRGTFTPGEALSRMLDGTGSRAVQLSPTSWRIEPRPATIVPPRKPRPVTPAPEPEPASVQDVPIVVTASKLDQSYRDYAGSVRILDGNDLRFGGDRGTESILSRLASVASTHLGSGRNKLFIRGMADSSFTGPTQATVGQYLDDLRLSYNAPDPDLRLYDISRVEILEGSQGTLYGAGSLGGIIRLVPNQPDPVAFSLDASAGLSLTEHGQPGGDMAATVNLPIGESGHALRITGYGISEGGYIDNPLRKENDINRSQIVGGRAMLRLDPGDGWTVDIGGVYQATRLDDAQYADRNAPALTRESAVVEGAQAHYGMATLVLRKDWGDLRFQSSNAYVNHALDESFDARPNGDAPQIFDQRNRTRMFSSETRLWRPVRNGVGWVLGFSAIDNRTEQRRAFQQLIETERATGVTNTISELTGYGKLSVEPLRGLILTGGGRITHSRLGGIAKDVQPRYAAEAAAGAGITGERTENELLPSAEILGHVTRHLSVYARYEEGFRPGGLAIETNFVRRFRNDHVTSWEVGARLGGPGDIIAANLSLAHSDWKDIQADFIDGNGLPTTANIGNGRITSIAGSITIEPTSRLRLDMGGVYNHSRVVALTAEVARLVSLAPVHLPVTGSFATLPEVGSIGALAADAQPGQIPNVADYAAQGSFDYRIPFERSDLRLGGWVKYIGPSRLGIGPVLGDRQGDYVDTGLVARLGDDRRGLTLSVTNLFDSKGNRFALGTPFDTEAGGFVTPQRPRTVRIAVDLRY
jgi:outer membrane receptor protein involved in Fe transport